MQRGQQIGGNGRFLHALDSAALIADEVMVVLRMLATMEGLLARVSVVELPGRHDELIPAERVEIIVSPPPYIAHGSIGPACGLARTALSASKPPGRMGSRSPSSF